MALAIGAATGVGGFTFVYASGASYLSNDSAACANCHVMTAHYDAWVKSSHHAVATCNDCHTPHAFLSKWWTKARNGYHHSLAFTTGRFHEPIQATSLNRQITEAACRYCHDQIVQAIDPPIGHDGQLTCTHCHRDVGHPL